MICKLKHRMRIYQTAQLEYAAGHFKHNTFRLYISI